MEHMVELLPGWARMGRWPSVLAVVFLGAGCSPLDDVLQGIFGRSMRVQSSIGAYENPLPPPNGSVPFAAGNFPAAPGMVNVGQPEVAEVPPPVTQAQLFQQAPEITEIPNPIPATTASLSRGEEVFNRACSPCHGTAGDGTGPVTRSGIPPFSLLVTSAMSLTDGYIYSIIRVGRGIMPPYGHQISHYDRWHVVNYVRQLQGPQAAVAQGSPETDPGQE